MAEPGHRPGREAAVERSQGWVRHKAEQAQRLARLPLPEKLRWLEATQRVVAHLTAQAQRKLRGTPRAGD